MTDGDRLLYWTTQVNAYLLICGERSKEVTVVTREEPERLVALKSSKWYQTEEPWKEYGAI
jgi:hypothetical protein